MIYPGHNSAGALLCIAGGIITLPIGVFRIWVGRRYGIWQRNQKDKEVLNQ